MPKDKEDLIAETTFHVSVAPGDIRTFHGVNSNVQDTVPPEFYEAAEKRKVKLIPRSDLEKTRIEIENKKRPEDDKIYKEEELKEMSKGDLTDIMLSRGTSRRDISKKKSEIISQIKQTNKKEDKVDIPKEKTE